MTKEELEKEAEEYTSNLLKDVNCTLGNPRARQINSIDIQDAYLASAEPREKRIAELETQIEEMKCCQNCLHLCARCELGIDGCYVCSKWELRR